jgi:uncharacterized membrane protein YfcA
VSELAEPAGKRHTPTALFLWLGGTFVGTICGIGGGLFATPILHYLCRVPFRTAIGTSLVLVLTMTLVATGFEAARGDSAIDWAVVGLLIAGSLPGTKLGHVFSKRVDVRTLKWIFVVLLVAAAARTLTIDASSMARTASGGVALDPWRILWIAMVGFGGGFLAPLLGIGGGIFVIPVLYLSLSDISYLEVRACSMAMGLVNSAQAVVLNWRDEKVDTRLVGPFVVIAVAGAVLGILAVHRPGWDDIARHTMTAVIVFVAARFAWDLWSTRSRAANQA